MNIEEKPRKHKAFRNIEKAEVDYIPNLETRLILKQISIAEMLIEDDTAISIEIHLPGTNVFSYWVDNNNFVLALLEKEREKIARTNPPNL